MYQPSINYSKYDLSKKYTLKQLLRLAEIQPHLLGFPDHCKN